VLDVSPRLTAPNPRIDAVRGCLAVERGPLVYCVERTDVPENVDLADLRLDSAAAPADAGTIELLAGMRGVTVPAVVGEVDGWSQVEYRDVRELPAAPASAPTVPLLAIPYFAWANRGTGAMRVWIPGAG
jgi:hypothetical protein